MLTMHAFARDEVLPSWWANAISRFLSLGAFNFQLTRQDATHIQVMAAPDEDAALIAVAGLWRYVEATVTRAHPGGAAGTYDIHVTAKANAIVSTPNPYTDDTDYSFGLAIVAAGTTPPIVAGVVDAFRKVGSCQWDGASITRVDQSIPATPRHAHSHATGGADALAPVDIGAAAEGDLLAEITRAEGAETNEASARVAADTAEANARASADTAESTARIAGDANNPTAGQKAALAGTSGAPADTNRYVTDGDARNTNARAPTAHKSSHEPGGSDALTALTDASVAAANKDGSPGLPGMRSLGVGAQQAAAGNDARLSNARTPTAHAASHLPGGTDALATASAVALTLGQGSAAGAAASFARSDHTHQINSIGGAVAAINFIVDSKLAAADADAAFAIGGDGTIYWGPGGATALDTTLKRSGANQLAVSGELAVNRASVGWGSIDAYGTIRASAANTGAGKGVELIHDGTTGWVQAYDRTAAGWTNMTVRGVIAMLSSNGGSNVSANSDGTSTLSSNNAGSYVVAGPTLVKANHYTGSSVQLDNSGDVLIGASSGASIQAQGGGLIYIASTAGQNVLIRAASGANVILGDSPVENTLIGGQLYPGNTTGAGTQTSWYIRASVSGQYISTNGPGGFQYGSDARLKKAIRTLSDPLEKLRSLRAVEFKWKHDGSDDIGFVAQEVAAVFPDLVAHEDRQDDGSVYMMDRSRLVAPLWEACKELLGRVEALESRLDGAAT